VVQPDKIIVKGKGAQWAYALDAAAQGRVAVRLELGAGPVWCAEATTPAVDRVDKYVARRQPAPASCPALPASSPSGAFVE
jgi:hypothetical protein